MKVVLYLVLSVKFFFFPVTVFVYLFLKEEIFHVLQRNKITPPENVYIYFKKEKMGRERDRSTYVLAAKLTSHSV